MMGRALVIWCLMPWPALAQGVQMEALNPQTAKALREVVRAAEGSFTRLPVVRLTSIFGGVCGGPAANRMVQYCTDQNAIFVTQDLVDKVPEGAPGYMLAHVYGHAVQVRHGQATRALAAIRAEPAREAELRGMVTRQVECIAGLIYGRALGPASLAVWFAEEPFTDSHWGRTPMSNGPRVSIGLEAREEWFQRGLAADGVEACAVGEMGIEALLRGVR